MKSPLFSELPIDVLMQCIDAMEEKEIPAVTDVVKQGEIGNTFFFIQDGELECKIQFIKVTKEGHKKKVEKLEPRLVKIYGPGDYFGELSLLYHIPRRGTIKTKTDSKLYFLNRNTYKKILKNSYDEKILTKINIFKNIQILETLKDDEFEKLEDISKEAIYHNGEAILKENEFSNNMYIIDEGKCIGTKTKEQGKGPVKNKEYRKGDIIGEFALLKGEKSQENIIVNSDTVKLICLDRFSFKSNLGSLETILMRNMDLYNIYFPPIEEKTEDQNKETIDKNNQNQQNVEPKNNEQNNLNTNNNPNNSPNNNINNNVNNEEIKKKILEEVEEEKKRMEMKHEEEIERLKQQLAYLQNQNEELTKQKLNNQIQESNNNISKEDIQVNHQIENEKQNGLLDENNINKNNNDNDNDNDNIPINNSEENNIQVNKVEENHENKLSDENQNQNEQEINNKLDINNNDIKDANNDVNNDNKDNIEQNQNVEEMKKDNKESINNEEDSIKTSKLELIKDKLTYQENENLIPINNEKQNGEEQINNEPSGLPMNQFELNEKVEENNNLNNLHKSNNSGINEFNENNAINDGEF